MSKESTDVEFLKKRILEDGVTEQQLKILLIEMDNESKSLGKYRKISESTKLQRIIGERGISITVQPTISSENTNEFQQYLKYRELAREGCSFMWESLKPKIKDLVDKIEKVEIEEKYSRAKSDGDQENINYYEKEEYKKDVEDFLNEKTTMTDFIYPNLLKIIKELDENYFPSLVDKDDSWKNPKDYENLYAQDVGHFDVVPKLIKEIFQMTYRAFLSNGRSKKVSYPDVDNIYAVHQAFENENTFLRYPAEKRRSQQYKGHRKSVISRGTFCKDDYVPPWYTDYKAKNEFQQFFAGSISFIDGIRNYEAHKEGPAKTLFQEANRYIKDPLTQMSSPTNYIILANSSSIILYELMEICQVWLDSKVIEKRALDGKITT
jgi:hypothetical protein